jgi:transcriptional regulator with XRE-family HTH domain
MPRKNPVPAKEQAICRRLREFRISTKTSQVLFAREIGLDSGQLRNYEHARAPLRFGLARQIFRAFSINPAWLATGKGEMHWYERLDPEINIPDQMLFSDAFERIIRPLVKEHHEIFEEKALGYQPHFTPPVGMPTEKIPGYYLMNSLPFALKALERDNALARRFVAEVHATMHEYLTLLAKRSPKK